ncbi:16S rRNA (cytosine(1402)-N(4))-methyltransferase RsmH [Mycolicibacterium fallax]|uniref:16S rRNA (cytosine(1402)-N(4))-methyltransferase RsmH n=1 Tax=Mycolicibacterium fallax TaxID=1793 RepID=UPI000A1481FD|nr:16S rRNA (cytosine(1402)-N(4))-methyltransferase RsmH [Mycolicibacterium fallax]
MKHFATASDLEVNPDRAPRSLSEPTLAYFPNARCATSDRGHGARAGIRNRCGGGAVADDPGRYGHVPVLLDRCIELLAPALTAAQSDGTGAVIVDATLGAGGHSEALLTRYPGLRVIGLDRDPSALAIAGQRLAGFGDRFTAVYARYDEIGRALAESGLPATASIDGVLFDLGVSSMQLDRVERGFSYSADAPLDMRMDDGLSVTAADILNEYPQGEIAAILREFGEERFAGRIAGAVVRRRASAPLRTTSELVELLYQAIPAATRRTGGHPAKRTFQALRIAVNAELDSLRQALPAALEAVRPGGRVVVMAYQSLEDRIVKQVFAAATASRSPAGLPVELPGYGPEFTALTRGAERADDDEIERNPRSAPVRLRAVQRRMEGDGR